MAGRLDYCPVIAAAISHIENKTMKAIAVLSRDRSPILPTLASAHEQGLTDFEANYWNGLFLPKATPEPIVQKLHDAVVAAIDGQRVDQAERDRRNNSGPRATVSDYLQKFVASEIERWAGPIRISGISLD